MIKPTTVTTDLVLNCPQCGGECLHHENVQVYRRSSEDDDEGLHVAMHRHVQLTTSMAGNPSPRRDGMRVMFSCENCPARPSLVIYQHKGSTYVGWEKVP